MTIPAQGQIADKPLGELIREFDLAGVSGVLRVSRDRAKAVVYFEKGTPIFAASNIRAHRLSAYLKRTGLVKDEWLAQISPTATDEEVLDLLVAQGKIRSNQATEIRSSLVAEILRVALLWIEGEWQFDARVKLAGEMRVHVDAPRLVLESTRHLPAAYIASRFPNPDERLQATESNGCAAILSPAEAFVASRVGTAMTIADLQTVSGLSQEETLRAVYALAMSGAITRDAWTGSERNGRSYGPKPAVPAAPKPGTVQEFIARVDKASDYYAVLDVPRHAEIGEIKRAYHGLARRYHPDRFHQAEPALRVRIESAFARIARAYETLTETTSRSAYDIQLAGAAPASKVSDPPASTPTSPVTPRAPTPAASARATASYEKGLAALKQNHTQEAIRFFAEAAHLEPRCACYRAEYGRALTADPQTRRIAEVELKAAIALEPANASYRVMLAELYQVLGLRRRAEAELQRALLADPKSEAARTLLANLKK